MTLVTVAELLLKLPLMQPQQLKKKALQPISSSVTNRVSKRPTSYLKTRIRGSRLQNAARIQAIIELSRRLHQAYEQAYDKQAADQLLPQNPGGTLTDIQELEIVGTLSRVIGLLGNAACAGVLGGQRNASALLNRAQFRYANTIDPNFRGTGGSYYDRRTGITVASQARNLALNPGPNRAFSEIGGNIIYVNDRFFSAPNIQQRGQDTLLIHELNRLNGYKGTDTADYDRITAACGTERPSRIITTGP